MSWPDLPAELIAGIAYRITSHADLARFRSVCPSWRSASAEHAACRRVPLLLLHTEDHFGVNRRLWSLADDTVVEVPVPAVRVFSFLYASHHGWMLGVADDLSATLLHPFTSASESLPALPPSFRDNGQEILCDMVWDKSPDAVMVSPGMGAYFCRLRPGDGPWSPVGGCSQGANHVSSITYCDGTVYLLDGRAHRVTTVDAETFDVAAVIEPPDMAAPPHTWLEPESALIVSSGELLLIVRTHLMFEPFFHGSDCLFKAFRADGRSPAAAWSEIAGATSASAPCSWTTSDGSASRPTGSTGCGGTASTWPARTRSSPMSTWWTATGATPCPCSTWTTSLPSPSRS
ncbi:hypothetical protein CFC21_050504 [Triticum aestivum]|uniref:KIB1-4 beta-propeller domain-containing protein n=2 Tax=Triticum aestivum TaxID=4565 RepID=A0A3B6H2M5_WHEAT|nr:hypothetical protein CFC21_050504 [Triticum aestivum]